MVIIENKKSLDNFVNLFNNNSSIIIPIYSDIIVYSLNNRITILCIYLNEELYILPFYHNDCINLKYDNTLKLLEKSEQLKFVYDLKTIIQLFNIKNSIDIESIEFINFGKIQTSLELSTNSHKKFYNKRFKNINDIIPITNHIESIEKFILTIKNIINQNYNNTNKNILNYINNIEIPIFANIEKSGIFVTKNNSINHLINENNIAYSKYNLYNVTGRPSQYSNYNFQSINKDDKLRKDITSRFGDKGRLILFDYNAHHFYLLGKILNENFNNINPYYYFAKQLTGKEIEDEEEYKQIKQLIFKLIYGSFEHEFEVIPFFKKIKQLSNELYISYNSVGYILTRIFKRKLLKNVIGDIKPNKLLNYYIQSFETENNILLMNSLFKLLKNKKSKFILYIYDGFLFDFNIDDGRELLIKIKNTLENNTFSTKMFVGKDYYDMKKINLHIY